MNRILRSRFPHTCANCGKPIPRRTQCYAEPHPYVKETLYIHLACGQTATELNRYEAEADSTEPAMPAPRERQGPLASKKGASKMDQYTTEQAIGFYKGAEWAAWSDEQIVDLQLYQDKLCIPFDRFHAAVEAVLGRPVWTHEFANMERLQEEYEGKRPTATFGDILSQLPQEKVIILVAREGK